MRLKYEKGIIPHYTEGLYLFLLYIGVSIPIGANYITKSSVWLLQNKPNDIKGSD